ncbi:Lysophospholipase L1 [Streptomyces sp. LaPpAH-199]|uniref:SGNH/GDSL hydrolase family protein n=1 Tax=Streptomyces TaxID=1883 RepID=UPI0008874DDD|nr:SGNH/GDSL hydrolase family protein [Streptomyces sp. LaPpAH-199]MYW78465.1 SGNH/GDSL hydrolase family protein [Streptomyces sp. SID8369]SDC74036.1 Lysophospholipase L1 [Streptomyces sp. LaPpAH-199]
MFELPPRRGTPLAEADGDVHGATEGHGPPLRLAVLGDSAAAGVGALSHREALAGQLAPALTALTGQGVSWRVTARAGATAEAVRRGLVPQLTDPLTRWTPDLVLVAVGIADARQLRGPIAFRRDVTRLVRDIRLRLGHHVPVVFAGLPSLDPSEDAEPGVDRIMRGYLWLLDRQLMFVAARHTATYHLPAGLPPRIPAEWLAADRFNLSPQGYRAWGRTLAAGIAPLAERTAAGPRTEPLGGSPRGGGVFGPPDPAPSTRSR